MDKLNALRRAAENFGCEVLENESMAKHTSFKIGGPADLFITAGSGQALGVLLDFCRNNEIQYTVLGNGSNVLVSDDGIRGAVIVPGGELAEIRGLGEGKIKCGAGAKLISVCRFALESELSGLEFAYGIPGSVGGAVFMNAGAYGGEIKDVIVSAAFIDKDGKAVTLPAEELDLSYRHSIFSTNGGIITEAVFSLQKAEKAGIKAKMDELMGRRRDKQPLEYPSAGSVFKRPEGAFAGTLIEQCGLKGYNIGGAMVSQKHAGFIVNAGGATANDVLRLVEHIQKTVFEQTGYSLECEIRKIGG
ncbi:MAG: UDP-N-acetylmuramate dehydrogenase [Clostridia bacterium]|nr:UDP-N-acetylmuramate dehydrogenase [Clostridia bacterium]